MTKIWTDAELRVFDLLMERKYIEVAEACRELVEENNNTWKWLGSIYEGDNVR
ncbi:MAG: hypothetical protein LBO02_00060 [Holosporaceae bacterium]|nr:hypothetical protein [Holosporaceae bacterium]